MPTLSSEDLKGHCARIFEAAGLDEAEAGRIAWSLVLSNLMGHDSHGVVRVSQYVKALKDGIVHPGKKISVIQDAPAAAVVDGEWGFGQTVCDQAMDLAISKAKVCAVSAVELYNSSHIGRLGEYVERAAEQGMIGICMCNNHGGGRLQAAFGGLDPVMSPNPVAVGVPTGKGYPIVVDMTSSVVAEGKIRMKKNMGEEVPEGWAMDYDGEPVRDPAKFYGPPRGAIHPFGGISAHKGYALAVVIDILSGALGGSGCSREGAPSGGNGVFLMAIRIEAFTGPDRFQEEVDTFIDFLKSSRRLPGFDEILMPGEGEFRRRRNLESEGVTVDDETWRQIGETAKLVGTSVD
jgi:uncharacterized oxidoreductase